MKEKKGQVWVETVVYTLIAFAMMGLVLSFVQPKIEESRDQSIIEQSKGIIEEVNYKIQDIKNVPGNQRIVDISVKEGSFTIDGKNNSIFFEMDSQYKYSEPGTKIEEGDLVIYTEEKGEFNVVTATTNYTDYNITYEGGDDVKKLHAAPSKYKLLLSNEGEDETSGKTIINFELQ